MNTALAVEVAVALARRWEGLRLRPYLCPAGVPTIGYGATYYKSGVRVTLGDAALTAEEAEDLLVWMVETKYLPIVVRLCPGIDTANRLAAIIDFTFNLGGGALSSSNLRRKINVGNWGAVPKELMKWINAAGKPQSGLRQRRKADADLI